MQINPKTFQDFNGILTYGLCVSAAVLYQLSYEDPYIGSASRPICWRFILTRVKGMKHRMKMMWTGEIQVLNEDLIVEVVVGYLSNLGKCHCLLLDCKTVRIFAYSSTREQSNKRSRFTDFFTDFEKKTDCFEV